VISHQIVRLPATNNNGHARVSPTDSHFVTGRGEDKEVFAVGTKNRYFIVFLGVFLELRGYQRDNGNLPPTQN
jgi:hypothetical protein